MEDYGYVADRVWQITDLLRGMYFTREYGRIILPMTLLRRLECVLAPTKERVLTEYERGRKIRAAGARLDLHLNRVAGQSFHNHSPIDLASVRADPRNSGQLLIDYIEAFSQDVRRIFECLDFEDEITRLQEAGILPLIASRFAELDLRPEMVPSQEMGFAFDSLVSRYYESAYDRAGEHFTPRDVARLMVRLLFPRPDRWLDVGDERRKLLDPACGTGGLLTEARHYLDHGGPSRQLHVYGQEINRYSWAMAAARLLISASGERDSTDEIRPGDIFTEDRFGGETFDYFLCHPPFGVDWKKSQPTIEEEHRQGYAGRFGAGLPRINDGSLLFLQHMWSKRRRGDGDGSRLVIAFNASPMFTGIAGSGESDIRRWLIEEDWLEAIIALPDSLLYNTGIGVYLWVLSSRKEPRRSRKVQLIDARDTWTPGASAESRRGMGDKRRHLAESQIDEIVRLYESFEPGKRSRLLSSKDLGYRRITIEYPLRLRYQMTTSRKERFLNSFPDLLDDIQAIDEALGREPELSWPSVKGHIDEILRSRGSFWRVIEHKTFRSVFTRLDRDGQPVRRDRGDDGFEPDPDLRAAENIPVDADPEEYFAREIAPHAPDAWLGNSESRLGYEIAFSSYFYEHVPPRPLIDIEADLRQAEEEILRLLRDQTR